MVSVPFSPYISMPMIAFGTWQVPSDSAQNLVSTALKAGYTHIDCAHIYNNEHEIGKLFGSMKDRNEVFITSKLWSDSHEKSKVRLACMKTLENLQLDSLDMYLMHNPTRFGGPDNGPMWFKKEWIHETWREMIKLKDEGLCKHVGVSNFTTVKLEWLKEESEMPSNNQVELHPYLPQNKLLNYCNEEKIILSAYSPLGTPGTRLSIPQAMDLKSPNLLEDPTICSIANKYNATSAQVLIKWGILRGTPVLVKSSSESRMIENLKSVNLEITGEDMDLIRNIGIKNRYLDYQFFCTEGHTAVEFWDGEFHN